MDHPFGLRNYACFVGYVNVGYLSDTHQTHFQMGYVFIVAIIAISFAEPFQELSVRVCVAVRKWRKQEYGFKRSNVGVAERERNCKRCYK
uniref:Uncharacterized protein n=1 Tax=Malus domestica TaxID=3750 RepID=E4Z8L7_MALDO|nr:hypothetical protein [Malus domestica]